MNLKESHAEFFSSSIFCGQFDLMVLKYMIVFLFLRCIAEALKTIFPFIVKLLFSRNQLSIALISFS